MIMKEKLTALVGQFVEVHAGDDCDDNNGVYFALYGKLEAPEDGYNRFYLRIADTQSGVMGIGFHPEQVQEINKRVYHMTIELKGRLNTSPA